MGLMLILWRYLPLIISVKSSRIDTRNMRDYWIPGSAFSLRSKPSACNLGDAFDRCNPCTTSAFRELVKLFILPADWESYPLNVLGLILNPVIYSQHLVP